ncbi:MAG: TasA family protein [Chloroflexi bacterium]|nr:TasA family protein [Chloroflexota bacterium]
MLRLALASLLTAGMMGTFVAADSLAVFTDSEANAANVFGSGTIVIDAPPGSAAVTLTNMAPGGFVISPLIMTNNGSLPLRYAMSTATTNVDAKALAGQLELTIRLKSAGLCSAEDGLLLYGPGTLAAGALGSNAQGAQAGDRELAAAANETLCFKVQLPLSTGNAFQNASTTATFTFDAEQTANNP